MGGEGTRGAGGHDRSHSSGLPGHRQARHRQQRVGRPQPRAGAGAGNGRRGRADAGRVGDRGHAAYRLERPLGDRRGRDPRDDVRSPEITDVGRDRVAWSADTRNFHSQYGAQRAASNSPCSGRGGHGPGRHRAGLGRDDARRARGERSRPELGRGKSGILGLQRATGGLLSLGMPQLTMSCELAVTRPSWYYVRVTLEDGEMAWSSPVWITPRAERSLPEAGQVGLLELAGLEMEPLAAVGATSGDLVVELHSETRPVGGLESRQRRPRAARGFRRRNRHCARCSPG